MNKRDLAKAIAVHADVDLRTTTAVVEALTDVVTAVVAQGEPVALSGFAKFVKVNRAARMGRNPATGETIRIKASKKARISPAQAFKQAVLSPALAPKLRRGAFPISDVAVRAAGKAPAAAATRSAAATPAKRRAAKKATTRRTTTKRATTRRATATKTTAPPAAATRATTTRRPAVKKATARRTTVKRTTVKASASRRPTAKKAISPRPTAKKTRSRR